ncbi:Protein CHLOROPLAST IMPORT APPARATUS 2 [Cardamine amara subsp. amara]|uniref:Protein CHLOROPLAST IMPORT APPARATUS 2 n=1 Tax=Cardamine amara subsp. amara TaxID=228776 RepID=A0ABD1AIV3_CARAN
MCSEIKISPVGEQKQTTRISIRIKKRKHRESTTTMDKPTSNLEASRKIRTKTKKPKFLSLKLELNTSHEINEDLGTKKSNKKKKNKKQSKTKGTDTTAFKDKKRAETTTLGGEKEEEQYDNVAAYLFNSATDSTISSIHDLLPSSAADLDCDGGGRNLSPYDHQEHGSSSSSLLRTAMRKGAKEEEETTEERWVSYSEVVEEVMSRSGTPRCCGGDGNDGRSSLALKLDYEQIMEAWSDKGTLYVDGEPPQTVPDLHGSTDGFMDGGEAGSLWAVPEMETTERLWRGHREASLLRYKEKRQNRLFSKRIRYQVRKLNAEKRPRVKGRFVKREDS